MTHVRRFLFGAAVVAAVVAAIVAVALQPMIFVVGMFVFLAYGVGGLWDEMGRDPNRAPPPAPRDRA